MRESSPVNAMHSRQQAFPSRNGEDALSTGAIEHDLSRFLRYRLAVLEAALRRVEELRRAAAFLSQPCNPLIH
jgi:hypothetical protein